MDRQDVIQIIEAKLRELNLDKIHDVLNREHNLLDGTHRKNIGKYVNYDDILEKPSSFVASSHSHDDLYYTETEIGAVLDITNKVVKTTVKARAYLGSQQANIANTTLTTVTLDTESYDPGSHFDTANNKFVCPVAGFYLVGGQVHCGDIEANDYYSAFIYLNAAKQSGATITSCDDTEDIYIPLPPEIVYASANDEFYLKVYVQGSAAMDAEAGEDDTWMAVHLLSV